jgi:chromosomal replication initiation ATPase DnaA
MSDRKQEQLPLPYGHTAALGAADFLVAPSNRLAVEWIERWPDWPFTALVVAGPEGSGKTHLAGLWQARSGANAIDLHGKRLEEIAGVTGQARNVLIDDCDRFAGNEEAELALLQLYNLLRAADGRLLLTAQRPPAEWPVALPDLASRLNSAMVVTLDRPDDTLLAALAVKLFDDRQLSIGPDIVPLLLERAERSFAGIARAVEALDNRSLEDRRNITPALVRKVLAELEGTDR